MSLEHDFPLGRREPTDFRHVTKYPVRSVMDEIADEVNKTLRLLNYRVKYDQRREGACVGFGSSWAMSILNRRFYDARWLWNEAKKIDEWDDTNPGDNNGTSVRAALDVLRSQGHCRVFRSKVHQPNTEDGIIRNRWAQTVDEMRTCIADGIPVVIGVDWYSGFDAPEKRSTGFWLPKPATWGRIRGGHCVCVYGASDRLQAFRFVNSWGLRYPLALLPYETMDRLLDQYGEATMITDWVSDGIVHSNVLSDQQDTDHLRF